MASRYTITLEEAQQHLTFDPDTGIFSWNKAKGRLVKAGDVAGSVHRSGYRRIGICGALVYAHRLAWLMHYGEEPADMIDHINGNRDDNRIANLRHANALINSQNAKRGRPNRTSGLLGVFSDANGATWSVHIEFMGKTVRTGSFATIEEAHERYLELKRRLHDGYVS
jgi:hypothetical protein